MIFKKKKSLFEKLTGTIRLSEDKFDDEDENFDEDFDDSDNKKDSSKELEIFEDGGELSVDVFQNPNEIIVKAMVVGVKPEDLDVEISRDMISIRGSRREENEVSSKDYYHKELFWGSFSRNIVLPEEIDVDSAKAATRNGMLTLRLPKVDKRRKAKLSIKPE